MSSRAQFLAGVKNNLPRLVVTRSDKTQVLVSWEQRKAVLAELLATDPQATIGVPGKLVARRVELAVKVLCPEAKRIYSPDGKHGGWKPMFASDLGEKFRVAKVRLPELWVGDDPSLFVLACREYLQHAELAYVTGGSLVLAAGTGTPGWLSFWQARGMEVKPSAKVGKRLKTLTRLYPYERGYESGQIRMKVLEDGDERLYDGIFAIRQSVVAEVMEASEVAPTTERIFNARILYQGGMVKGNCVAVPDEVMDQRHGPFDVVTHQVNIKDELAGWRGWRIGLDPHPPQDEVRTDLQSMVNLPQLFPTEEVKTWIGDHARKVLHHIASGEVLDDFERLNKRLDVEEEANDQEGLYTQTRYNALAFTKAGFDLRHSPALVERLFDAHVKGSFYEERGKINVPVPCAWRMQVISRTAAWLCGYDIEPDWGQLRVTQDGQLAVVTDEDWLDMIPNHGGCDMDDSFALYYRTEHDCKRIVVLRSPNDLGEYSVFDYAEGDPYPVSVRYVGTKVDQLQAESISWPVVDLSQAPQRLQEAINAGEVEVKGLPTSSDKPETYDQAAVEEDLKRALAGTNPGVYVNAKMLWNATVKQHMPTVPATMESIVDACQQGGCKEALLQVRHFAREVFLSTLNAGLPIDKTFWASHGYRLKPEDPRPVLVEGELSMLFEHLKAVYVRGKELLAKKAQEWHEVPQALLFVAGEELKEGRAVLKAFRGEAFNLARNQADRSSWDALHEALAGSIENVKAFAAAVHTTPTSAGKVSDGVLWSKALFEKYLKALQD